jgi:hypothetical protein
MPTFNTTETPIPFDLEVVKDKFGVGDIHGTTDGNLFFLIYGTGGFSSCIICCLFKSLALFQWQMNQSL